MAKALVVLVLAVVACRVEPGWDGDSDVGFDADCSWTDATSVCGDGHVECDEECDDGDGIDEDHGDICAAGYGEGCILLENYCGDGTVDDGEECDDGNRISLEFVGALCEIEG